MKAASPSAQTRSADAQSPFYVMFLAATVAVSGFLLGYNTAVINGVLVFLRRQFALTNVQTEVATSAVLLGCLIGAAGASLIGDSLGRRKSLLITSLVFMGATLLTSLADTLWVFCAGRLAVGIAIGIASVLTPVYISEIAPPANRGMLVSMNQLACVIGILVAYLASWGLAGLGDVSWRWMLGAAELPSLVFCLGLFSIPESPRWLISHGQREKGHQVLGRILGAEEADLQTREVEGAADGDNGSWSEVFSRPMRRPLMIAFGLALFSQITGINAVLYYGAILIGEHLRGQTTGSALASSVIIGLANLISTVAAMRFLDRWGRRAMLMIASGGMALSLGALVLCMNLNGVPAFAVLTGIILYVAFFAFGMGPVPWVVISEIFPNKVRGRAASVATSILWSGTLLITFTFLSMLRSFGVAGTFAVFGVLSAMAFVFVFKLVPETRGKSLEEIQSEWRA